MKNFLNFVISGCLLVVFVSGDRSENVNPVNVSLSSRISTKALPIQDSIFKLCLTLQQLGKENKTANQSSENFVISPLGFSLALGQIAAAANPDLRDTIYQLMEWQNDDSSIHEQHLQLLMDLLHLDSADKKKEDESFRIDIASAMFYQKDIELRELFTMHLKKYYKTDFIDVPFSSNRPESQKIINEWISRNSHNLINEFPIADDLVSILANIVYFQGDWMEPFADEYTRRGKFFVDEQTTVNISYMLGQQEVRYTENKELNCKMIQLPYKSERRNTSMYIILPNNFDLNDLLDKLTVEIFKEMKSNLEMKTVNIKMPKLTLRNKLALKDILINLKRKQKLSQTEEELKKNLKIWARDVRRLLIPVVDQYALTNATSNPRLLLSDVVQEVVLNVYEKGTTAAALTGGIMNYDNTARNFRVDKPYLIVIKDDNTNVVLFWGAIYRPTEI